MTLATATKRVILAALAVLTLSAIEPASPARAQAGGETDVFGDAWSRAELEAFASAAVKIADVRQLWQMRIAHADTPKQARDYEKRMVAGMHDAIEAEGLSVEDYNRIYAAARADPRLYDEVRTLIQRARDR